MIKIASCSVLQSKRSVLWTSPTSLHPINSPVPVLGKSALNQNRNANHLSAAEKNGCYPVLPGIQRRDWHFSVKGHILGFGGHITFFATTQLCRCNAQTAADNMETKGMAVCQ